MREADKLLDNGAYAAAEAAYSVMLHRVSGSSAGDRTLLNWREACRLSELADCRHWLDTAPNDAVVQDLLLLVHRDLGRVAASVSEVSKMISGCESPDRIRQLRGRRFAVVCRSPSSVPNALSLIRSDFKALWQAYSEAQRKRGALQVGLVRRLLPLDIEGGPSVLEELAEFVRPLRPDLSGALRRSADVSRILLREELPSSD